MTESTPTAAEYWEDRYRGGKTWSGKVNVALERELAGVTPGTALDLGSGEGGDALWLARNGWAVTAVDIAPSAHAIAAAEARPEDDVTWVTADLSTWQPDRTFDLVTSCFLHSTVELPRDAILRRTAAAVAPGGHLLIVGHYGAPHWVDPAERHGHDDLPSPDEVYAMLFATDSALDAGDWEVVTKALVERPVTAPDGSPSSIVDGVLRLRRQS